MSKNFDTLLLGAWKLIEDMEYSIHYLLVPIAWSQVAQSLASERARSGHSKYPSIPVSSLNHIVSATFPQIIKTERNAWRRSGTPWIFASEAVDISHLPELVKDWLREEFGWCLGEDAVNLRLAKLNNNDWHWEKKIITNYYWSEADSNYKIDFRYKVMPNFIAKEFLKNPTVTFYGESKHQLTFYPVVRLEGAELMSFPPQRVPLLKFVNKDNIKQLEVVGEAQISFVITFKLHTVPWRSQPMIYHQLSVRRWITQPKEKLPYNGATAYIGDNHRWLDGSKQPFTFMPLSIKRKGTEGLSAWHRAISELLKINSTQLPDPDILAEQPNYNWSEKSAKLKAAIAYDNRHRVTNLCFPGVSPLDLASLDQAIEERIEEANLPLRRVSKAIKVSGNQVSFWQPGKPHKKEDKEPKEPNDLSTPMLRPIMMAPAAFRCDETSPQLILILWETQECREALIEEICKQLLLSQKHTIQQYVTTDGAEDEEAIYKGIYGSLRIRTQFVSDKTGKLKIEIQDKNRQKKRAELIDERVQDIIKFLPKPQDLSGALVEIKPKNQFFPPESDPKLALRIGVMKAGYVNQFILPMKAQKKTGELYTIKSFKNRVQRAVSDLLRQFGILPAPLIDPEKDGINANMWLTCFYVLRRTRKTTASNKATTIALMVRVNPVTGMVQATTPNLFPEWVSYPKLMGYLITEKWEPESENDAIADEVNDEQANNLKHDRKLLDKFVNDCLKDCLSTAIENEENPRVLFMAEAQNARKILTWLQNPNLPANDIPAALDFTEAEKNRLWVVRLRVADNGEVPVSIIKGYPGSRGSGVFKWENVCEQPETDIYLSLRKPLTTEQNTLKVKQSRFDDGYRQAGNPKLLEISIVHHPDIEQDKLAIFIHDLRNRWPYFADDISLAFPFPLAKLAKEYAVSAKDVLKLEDLSESEETEDLAESN